jgi:selenocysteine lyase/cysteine desulfurase
VRTLNASQIAAIRSRFPVFRNKIYLNSCSQGALSDRVEGGLLAYLRSWHEQGSPWELWIEHYEAARAVFADFVGAEADEVALVASASAGINSLASALSFRTRRKVVLGEFEFPTMGHIWLAQRPRGAEIVFVKARGDCLAAEDYDALIDRNTLIVPLTRVCFMNGFRMPAKEVIALTHDRGALALLDDYQDCGSRPVDVKAMDLDFYVSGTLKYLLGPPGVAFLYVRRSLIESMVPTATGWFGQANPFAFDVKRLEPSPSARRFQAGTPPIPSIYGAREGVALLQEIGLQEVAEQVKMLTISLLTGARDLGIQTKTPSDSVGPLVVLRARDTDALVQKLAAKGIVVSSRRDGLRISFHVYNTLEDVHSVLQVLEQNLDLLVTTKSTHDVMSQP